MRGLGRVLGLEGDTGASKVISNQCVSNQFRS
jgi:hypothetical protein